MEFLEYFWHQLMVTQYQARAMRFFITWHNLITLISQCLIYRYNVHWSKKLIGGRTHTDTTENLPTVLYFAPALSKINDHNNI